MGKLSSIKPRITTLDTRRGAPVGMKRIIGREAGRIRDRIKLRDEYTCQKCGRLTVDGEVDHIVPLAVGGSNNHENLQWLCKDCHKAKSLREEKERGL